MSMPASILIGLGCLAVLVLAIFEAIQVYNEGGLRLFVWPKLSHGYEVTPVTRLSIAPWVLLLFLLAGNGVVIALFGHDLVGYSGGDFKPWLAAALLPVALIHLIGYRRSVIAAVFGLVLLAAGIMYMLEALDAWSWAPLLAPILLWAFNGVRAVHADRSMS